MSNTNTPVDFNSPNFYVRLGVSADATLQQIQKAYKQLAFKCHPDKSKDPNATANFQKLSEAFVTLSDSKLRRAHDEELAARSSDGSEPDEAAHAFHSFDESDDEMTPKRMREVLNAIEVVIEAMFGNRLPREQQDPKAALTGFALGALSIFLGALTGHASAGTMIGVLCCAIGVSQATTGNAINRLASVDPKQYQLLFELLTDIAKNAQRRHQVNEQRWRQHMRQKFEREQREQEAREHRRAERQRRQEAERDEARRSDADAGSMPAKRAESAEASMQGAQARHRKGMQRGVHVPEAKPENHFKSSSSQA